MITKSIVILANSKKWHGYCVAGKEVNGSSFGEWFRPVSSRPKGELSIIEQRFEDKKLPRVLDVVSVELDRPMVKLFQTENWLITGAKWEKTGRMKWADCARMADPISKLWIEWDSTYHGCRDKIKAAAASQIKSSLRLIHVLDLRLRVHRPNAAFGNNNKKLQGRFEYAGSEYWLSVTDPVYENMYLPKADGDYDIGEAYMIISIGEPMADGSCFKLIAAIIERARTP